MPINKRQLLTLVAAAAATALPVLPAAAQEKFPERIINFVVPFSPGGPTDAMARLLAAELTRELGQSVVVDNRAGAGGNIGAEAVARAKPDGYNILFGTSGPLAINHSLYKEIRYDPRTSFDPVIYVGYLPNVLVVRPDLGVSTVQQLITKEKAAPGKLNYASSGNGASSHLAGVLFNDMAGTKLVHVPFKGTGPALNALLAGQVDMTFTDILTAMPYIKSGKFKALGMTTTQRSKAMPDIPTVAEQGLKGFDVSVFFGVVAPKGTPPDRIKVLNEAFVRALAAPKVKDTFAAQGLESAPDHSPAYLGQLINKETDAWAKVVQSSGVRLD